MWYNVSRYKTTEYNKKLFPTSTLKSIMPTRIPQVFLKNEFYWILGGPSFEEDVIVEKQFFRIIIFDCGSG